MKAKNQPLKTIYYNVRAHFALLGLTSCHFFPLQTIISQNKERTRKKQVWTSGVHQKHIFRQVLWRIQLINIYNKIIVIFAIKRSVLSTGLASSWTEKRRNYLIEKIFLIIIWWKPYFLYGKDEHLTHWAELGRRNKERKTFVMISEPWRALSSYVQLAIA